MTATALALGVSGIALADDSSMNPFTGESFVYFNGGQNHGNPNILAQNPHPQGAVAAGTRQKKDELESLLIHQKIRDHSRFIVSRLVAYEHVRARLQAQCDRTGRPRFQLRDFAQVLNFLLDHFGFFLIVW